MNLEALHSSVVRRFFEALNSGNLEQFMNLFTSDASVEDVTDYQGLPAIRDWVQRENFNVQLNFHPLHERNEADTVVEGTVQSTGGYSGPATFTFTLKGEHIKRVVIT